MIGIIGGTGLYSMEGLTQLEEKKIQTPFGQPSAPLVLGKYESEKVAFLPRHGIHHELLPSEINYLANIWALKSVGVERVLSVSAVGSLTEEIRPGDLAVPSQYLDFTKGKRVHTFFGDGLVAHISTAEPTCLSLSRKIKSIAESLDVQVHIGKTYACVEGPRLGNKAESHFFRKSECHLVGMTNVPEVYLAREAGLCYCTISVVTDYDCWLEDPAQHASTEQIISRYKLNLQKVQKILKQIITSPQESQTCQCRQALEGAVLTPESCLSVEKKSLLKFLKNA